MDLRWLSATGAVLLLGLPAADAATFPTPIAPDEHLPLDAVAYAAIQEHLNIGGFLQSHPESGVHYVRDQMLGTLAALHMADRAPEDLEEMEAAALALWRSTRAFDPEGNYHYINIVENNDCVDLATNAWGLLAAWQLEERLGEEAGAAQARGAAIVETLTDLIVFGAHAGVEACDEYGRPTPDAGVFLWSLPLWAMGVYLSANPDAEQEEVHRQALDELVAGPFDGRLSNAGGRSDVTANAQLLAALTVASQLHGDPTLASARDQVLAQMRGAFTVPLEGASYAVSLDETGAQAPPGSEGPAAALWTAFALNQYDRKARAGQLGDEVPRLLDGLVRSFWDPSTGAILDGAGRMPLHENALAVLFTWTPGLQSAIVEESVFQVAVRANAAFVFPSPKHAEAGSWYLDNLVNQGFRLSSTAGHPAVLFYPVSEFGAYDFSLPASGFYPAPSVTRGRGATPVPVELFGDRSQFLLLREPGSEAVSDYVLRAYVPASPLDYSYARTVDLRIANPLRADLTVSRLVIELEATNIQVRQIDVGGVVVLNHQTTAVPPNTFLPITHTKLTMNNVPLRPGVNTIRIQYEDVEPPVVTALDIARDPAGRSLLTLDDQGRFRAITNQPSFAFVQVHDNTRVGAVELRIQRPETAGGQTVTAAPSVARPGWYVAALPMFPEATTVTVAVLARDVHDNIDPSASAQIDVRPSWLAGGNLPLFVFAGVLCFATALIYFKVRHRTRSGPG